MKELNKSFVDYFHRFSYSRVTKHLYLECNEKYTNNEIGIPKEILSDLKKLIEEILDEE
ncbi:MAG: hypothetical protein GF364_14310 [Candidatus Lokiarchaeota archaeon]|nr:hypothetical protein [Candidatus Lokiarchaeota archaeon]